MLDTIILATSLGYEISFRNEINQFVCCIIKRDGEHKVKNEQVLPNREDHIKQYRISHMINWMITECEDKLKQLKNDSEA